MALPRYEDEGGHGMRSFEMRICDVKDLLEQKEKYENKISNWEYEIRNNKETYDYFLHLKEKLKVNKDSLKKINTRLDNMLKIEDKWLEIKR